VNKIVNEELANRKIVLTYEVNMFQIKKFKKQTNSNVIDSIKLNRL
jgi:hypothetical protein